MFRPRVGSTVRKGARRTKAQLNEPWPTTQGSQEGFRTKRAELRVPQTRKCHLPDDKSHGLDMYRNLIRTRMDVTQLCPSDSRFCLFSDTRVLLGLVNGMMTASKTLVSEVCGPEHDTVGMGLLTCEICRRHHMRGR